jgi:hypothetical protein
VNVPAGHHHHHHHHHHHNNNNNTHPHPYSKPPPPSPSPYEEKQANGTRGSPEMWVIIVCLYLFYVLLPYRVYVLIVAVKNYWYSNRACMRNKEAEVGKCRLCHVAFRRGYATSLTSRSIYLGGGGGGS